MSNPLNRCFELLPLITVVALTAGCGTNDIVDSGDAEPGERTLGAKEALSHSEGSDDPGLSATAASAVGGGLFTRPTAWNKDVSSLPKAAESDEILGWLVNHGGYGTKQLRIEFSLKLLWGTSTTPFRHFTPTDDFFSPDCDQVPFPLPAGGAIENNDGYACEAGGDSRPLRHGDRGSRADDRRDRRLPA